MNVPFVDLHAQYLSIKSEVDAAISEVIAQSAFIRGPEVERCEQAWEKTRGVKQKE
jgi:dTDP-4-amino-4,6-dideoxygalactose transaminase